MKQVTIESGRIISGNVTFQLSIFDIIFLVFYGAIIRAADNIQGYYKRHRHFQCCIEMKLLMF
jgi:hypothetical protein